MNFVRTYDAAILEHLHHIAEKWIRMIVRNVLTLKVAECGGAIAEAGHYQVLFSQNKFTCTVKRRQ